MDNMDPANASSSTDRTKAGLFVSRPDTYAGTLSASLCTMAFETTRHQMLTVMSSWCLQRQDATVG